jgi:hypothetical protein
MPETTTTTNTPTADPVSAESRQVNVGSIVWYAFRPLSSAAPETLEVAPLLVTRINRVGEPSTTVAGFMVSLNVGQRFFKAVPFSPVLRHEHWSWPTDEQPQPVWGSGAEQQAYGMPPPTDRPIRGRVDASI